MQRQTLWKAGAALILAVSGAGAGTTCTFSTPVTSSVREYFPAGQAVSPNSDPRCSNGRCSLSGWLYVPQLREGGSTPPGLILNHGHAMERGEFCAIAEFFTSRGFVVFAPLRRGNTDVQAGIQNTGIYIDQCILPGTTGEQSSLPKHDPLELWCLQQQVAEVQAAVRFLTSPSPDFLVSSSKIALMGHSFGGSLSVFAAAATLPFSPKAAISISGGALDWSDNVWYGVPLQPGLPWPVRNRKMPIFFLQPSNEQSLEPTRQLSQWAAATGNFQFEAALYPAVQPTERECSTIPGACSGGQLTNKQIHGDFVTRQDQVDVWGPTAIDFLKRYGVQ